ncbi:MAG: threonine/serine exporter family protein, partial [Clostridia bacterium]|nr:threonine/serine exporter family protein [Clostridia bacterium]
MEEQIKDTPLNSGAATESAAASSENGVAEKSTENVVEATDYDGVLELALEVGAGLLSSGGSVSRVETAVDRICTSYGAHDVNVAAYPSMIQASLRSPDGRGHTFVKRVYSVSNNLKLLEAFNQLSRDICKNKYPVKEAQKMCFELVHSNVRNKWVTIAGASLVSGIYSIFFGGTIADVLPALVIAFVMSILNEVLSKRSLNAYASTFILSLVGGVLSVLLCKLLNVIGLPCQGAYVM